MAEQSLLKVSSDVAAVMQTILKLSDEAEGSGTTSIEGIIRLHSLIQKNKSRIVALVHGLCDRIDAEKLKKEKK